MTESADLHSATEEFADDAAYAWWINSHPRGYVLAVRARKEPLLHRATCRDVDRDRKPGALKAKGSRQLCASSPEALRAWLRANEPATAAMLARCPKCGP